MKNTLVLIALLTSLLAAGQEKINPTDTLLISGKIKNERALTLSDLNNFPQKNIPDVIIINVEGETKGTAKNLKGVLLKSIIENIGVQANDPKELNAFYFICIASDGYKVVFSWNEIFNTGTGNNLYIITEKDGKKMNEMNNRILLISTTDFVTGRRYIKGLKKIIVDRIDQPAQTMKKKNIGTNNETFIK